QQVLIVFAAFVEVVHKGCHAGTANPWILECGPPGRGPPATRTSIDLTVTRRNVVAVRRRFSRPSSSRLPGPVDKRWRLPLATLRATDDDGNKSKGSDDERCRRTSARVPGRAHFPARNLRCCLRPVPVARCRRHVQLCS